MLRTALALSHGSLHFVLHGSFHNRLFQKFWLVVEKYWPIRKWLKMLPWTKNWDYHVKEHKNLYQKQMSKMTLHFVWGLLLRKQTVLIYSNLWVYIKEIQLLSQQCYDKQNTRLKLLKHNVKNWCQTLVSNYVLLSYILLDNINSNLILVEVVAFTSTTTCKYAKKVWPENCFHMPNTQALLVHEEPSQLIVVV